MSPRGRQPRVYPSDLVEHITRMYQGGATILEVQATVTGVKVVNVLRRHGITRRPAVRRIDDETRFWAKVDAQGDCWTFSSLNDAGYGQFHVFIDGRRATVRAHRYCWKLLVGPIPDGLVLDHRCCNRACVNPDHLDPVTNQVNVARGPSAAIVSRRNRKAAA